jgi:hypothetical protein
MTKANMQIDCINIKELLLFHGKIGYANCLKVGLDGASFRATRSMRLVADWGMQRRVHHVCAHG